jgi:hypothetical protein
VLGVHGRTESEEDEGEGDATEHWFSVFEDFGEKLVVDLIELLHGGFEGGLVFTRGFVKIFAEAIGGVVEEHLGVLDAFAVAGEVHVNELRVVVDFLQRDAGLFDVAVEHLLSCDLRHSVNEFGIEEALVARTGLLGAEFELGESFRSWKIVVDGGGVGCGAEREKQR